RTPTKTRAPTDIFMVKGVLGLLGNLSLVLAMFQKGVWRRPAVNLYVLAIVTASLIESVTGYPVLIASNFHGRWMFGEMGCTFYAFTVYTCVIVQMTCFLMVTIHRYRVVVQQMPANSADTRHWIAWSVAGAWVYGLAWSMYNMMVFIFMLFLPVIAMVILSVKVIKKVNMTVAVGTINGPIGNGTTTTNTGQTIQTRSLKIVVMTLVVFLICWSPYGIMSMLSNFDVHIPPSTSVLPTMMTKMFPAINPMVYFVCYHHYRISFRELFGQDD
ncbi:hypothetical protein BaRGS_00021704, partial [Batillaria attramentaria]